MTTLNDKATEALSHFETAKRDDGEKTFIRTKEGTPQWVTDLIFAAHDNGEMLPNDERYKFIQDALYILSEIEDADEPHERIDSDVDVYNHDLLQWVASHLSRAYYVDEAIKEFGWNEERGLFGALMVGQYSERMEVYNSVKQSLEALIEDEDEDEDEDEHTKSCAHGVSLYDNCQECGGQCEECGRELPWIEGEGLGACEHCDDESNGK